MRSLACACWRGRGCPTAMSTWFNGSPFVWPIIAAAGHHLAGLAGARLLAAVLSTVTLVAIARAAGHLFGHQVPGWCALALAVNGLFFALAHFAVYDVAALTCLAVSMWCASRSSGADAPRWVVGAAVAFAMAVVSKYGYAAMVAPVVGLLLSVQGVKASARAVALFLSTVGMIAGAYFLVCFGTLFPPSSGAYLEQAFGRSRGHIATLHVVFALVPFGLAVGGAAAAWRTPRGRSLAVTCLLALLVYPAFHVWTANFVSGQKHVVAGFLFAYLLGGLALARLWAARSRAPAVAVLSALTVSGALQGYWQDHSWADIRPLADYLVRSVRPGERLLAESPWSYTMYLYPARLVASPSSVIDANSLPERDQLDICQIPWVAGNPDSAPAVRHAVERCRHQHVLSARTQHWYFDTSRLRLVVSSVGVGLYRLPSP